LINIKFLNNFFLSKNIEFPPILKDISNISNQFMNVLKFERNLLDQIQNHQNSLCIVAKGLGVHRIAGLYIKEYIDQQESTKPRAYLIFLIHFTDQELLDLKLFYNLDINNVTEDLCTNRVEYYKKGGIFSITSKILTLDLLSKRISPSIITGIILLHTHKLIPMSMDNFLLKIYRKENSHGFLKCLTTSPSSLTTSPNKLSKTMQLAYVNTLILCPRSRSDVCEILDNCNNIIINEYQVKMDRKVCKMHNLLLKLITSCVEELNIQLSQMGKKVKQITLSYALDTELHYILQCILGKDINVIGHKAMQNIKDISVCKRLVYRLLTGCSIGFWVLFLEAKFYSNQYSVFQYADEGTNKLIQEIESLAKSRVFRVKHISVDDQEILEWLSEDQDIIGMDDEVSKVEGIEEEEQNREEVERVKRERKANWVMSEVAEMNENSKGYWGHRKIEFVKENLYLKDIEDEYELELVGQVTEKWDTVVQILKKIYDETKEIYRRCCENVPKENKISEKSSKLKDLKFEKRKIMIVVKTEKCKRDLERYLASYFIRKDHGKSMFELNFKNFLHREKELERRQNILKSSAGEKK
jgi:hypothetical protein